jgi:predicted Fe-Mo cluster-binding NifX family protein
MNIAIPSEGQKLTSLISSTLGKAPFIIIYNNQTTGFQSFANLGFNLQDGSGLQAAEIITKNNVDVLLTKEIGRKAYSVLMKEHIDVHLLKSGGTIKSVINKFLKEKGK